MNTWMYFNLQNSNSPLMEQLMFFHNHSMLIILLITILVGYIMSSLFYNKLYNRYLLESQNIEIIWTILPAFMLIFIALPSLRLLYLLDDSNSPLISSHMIMRPINILQQSQIDIFIAFRDIQRSNRIWGALHMLICSLIFIFSTV